MLWSLKIYLFKKKINKKVSKAKILRIKKKKVGQKRPTFFD